MSLINFMGLDFDCSDEGNGKVLNDIYEELYTNPNLSDDKKYEYIDTFFHKIVGFFRNCGVHFKTHVKKVDEENGLYAFVDGKGEGNVKVVGTIDRIFGAYNSTLDRYEAKQYDDVTIGEYHNGSHHSLR